jgi:hypothetical protein
MELLWWRSWPITAQGGVIHGPMLPLENGKLDITARIAKICRHLHRFQAWHRFHARSQRKRITPTLRAKSD